MKAIDKTEDMKETEFKPGEYCRFNKEVVESIFRLLEENDWPIYSDRIPDTPTGFVIFHDLHKMFMCYNDSESVTNHWRPCNIEISFEQFMFKATRGKGDRKEAMASAYDKIRQKMEHANSTRGKGISTSAKNAQVEFDPEKPYEISFNFPDDEQVEWETGYHFIGFKKNGNIIVEREDGRLRAVAQIRNIFHAGMLKRGEFMIDEQGDIYTYVYSGCASSMNLRTNQTYGDLEGSKIRGKRVKLNITTEEI